MDEKNNAICGEEGMYIAGNSIEECMGFDKVKTLDNPRVLLHSCCGPCSTACIERIAPEYNISIYFYNPNITDREEYERRKENQIKFINEYNRNSNREYKIDFIEGDYDPWNFIKVSELFKDEPEGGKRCHLCFELRLARTAEYAAMHDFDTYGTTLTVSPHKNYNVISEIGKKFAGIYGVGFLDIDFKKKDGFKRSIELSKEYDLYRQDFCGCEYSRWREEK